MKSSKFLLIFIIFSVTGRCAIAGNDEVDSSKGGSSKKSLRKQGSDKLRRSLKKMVSGKFLTKSPSAKESSTKTDLVDVDSGPTEVVVHQQMVEAYEVIKENEQVKKLKADSKEVIEFKEKPNEEKAKWIVQQGVKSYKGMKKRKGAPSPDEFKSLLEEKIEEVKRAKRNGEPKPAFYKEAIANFKHNAKALETMSTSDLESPSSIACKVAIAMVGVVVCFTISVLVIKSTPALAVIPIVITIALIIWFCYELSKAFG